MKILKYILYSIVILVLLFFLAGIVRPTIYYGHEITVNKPLKESWAVSQDESKFPQWLEGFKSIELISGEKGQMGSKYKVIVKPSEEEPDFEMIETIVSIKEFEALTLRFDSDMMDFEQTIYHKEVDGKATLRTASTVSGKGMMMRSMFALMDLFSGSFQTQEMKNIEALKKVIEENKTDYYPVPMDTTTISELEIH